MDVWQSAIEDLPVGAGRERRLDGVSDNDLLFLFSYDAQRSRPDESPAAPPSTNDVDPLDDEEEETLTLEGDAPWAEADEPDASSEPSPAEPSADSARTESPPEPHPVSTPADSTTEESLPAEAEAPTRDEPEMQQVILRLGDEPVAVRVRPEPHPPWALPDEHWPRLAGEQPPAADAEQPPSDSGRHVAKPKRAAFELRRWIEAAQPDYLGPVDQQIRDDEKPAVMRIPRPDTRGAEAAAHTPKEAQPGPSEEKDKDPKTRPLVTRFTPPKRAKAQRAAARTRLPLRTITFRRQAARRAVPFRWRQMVASAAMSGALGSAALLMIYWLIR
ncbi:MAG TPA: hypothetical protein VM243_20570 [Phycisphaerae bacterium]|nr:hypothetical protein [Phycisphaerae bacterium]